MRNIDGLKPKYWKLGLRHLCGANAKRQIWPIEEESSDGDELIARSFLSSSKEQPIDYKRRIGNVSPLDQSMETGERYPADDRLKSVTVEDKRAAVHMEMKRMNRLPPNSVYAAHRLRVLNKVLQLMSLQRTSSQDEELELLFASLSI